MSQFIKSYQAQVGINHVPAYQVSGRPFLMSNFIKSYQANVGLNHTPAYQVSGQPFASGSIDGTTGTAVRIQFPYVTRWVQITNHDGSNELTASFSQAGLSGGNHFKIHEAQTSGKAKFLKCGLLALLILILLLA